MSRNEHRITQTAIEAEMRRLAGVLALRAHTALHRQQPDPGATPAARGLRLTLASLRWSPLRHARPWHRPS